MEKSLSPFHFSPLAQRHVPTGVRAIALAALLTAASSCSSHDSSGGDDTDGGASGRSSAGRGGSGGTSGTAADGFITCGSTQCGPPANILAALPIQTGIPAPVACCADEATGQCGSLPTADAMCEPPPIPEPRCPGVDLGALAAIAGGGAPMNTMTGCCLPDNKCGLDGTAFGRGCVENEAAAALLRSIPLLGGLVMVPASRACDEPPPEPEPGADGGAEEDAG